MYVTLAFDIKLI